MAQSGYTPIQLYSSPTPGASPAASNLTNGELAINVADGKLFFKNTAGNTQVLADSTWAAYSSGVGIQGSGTNVVNTGTVQFANSNGVTFGLSGSTMTASVNAIQGIQGSGTNVATGGTVQFANSNGVTFGLNGNTMTATVAPSPITVSAGTTSAALNNVVFASSNGISFGLTSNTITAQSYASSYAIDDAYKPYIATAGTSEGVASLLVAPFILPNQINVVNIEQPLVRGGGTFAYGRNSSSTLSDVISVSATAGITNGLYSRTSDTLTLITSATITNILSFNATVRVTAAGGVASFTANCTQIYASGLTGTSYGTISATATGTGTIPTITFNAGAGITIRQYNVPISSVAAKSFVEVPMPLYSTPTLINSGAYWVANAGSTSSSVSISPALGVPFEGVYGAGVLNSPLLYSMSSPQQIMRNEALNVDLAGNAPAYSAYNNFFGYNSNGSVYTYTGYNTFASAFPGSSAASTAYSATRNTTATAATLFFPKMTLA